MKRTNDIKLGAELREWMICLSVLHRGEIRIFREAPTSKLGSAQDVQTARAEAFYNRGFHGL